MSNGGVSVISYPEFLADIVVTVGQALLQQGTPEEAAQKIAQEAAEAVRKNFGGQLLYIPRGHRFDLSQRDIEIWNKFTGRNQQQLAAEYKMSVIHIYRIIARVGMAQRKRMQPDMFNTGE